MKKGLSILATLMAVGLLLPGYGLADTLTLSPTDDAFVNSTTSTWNYGDVINLLVAESPVRQTYLKFDLTSLSGINPLDVTSVKLRLYVTTSFLLTVNAYHSPDNYSTSSNPWENGPTNFGNATPNSPTGITWDNKPDLTGALLMGTSPNLDPRNAYYTIDLLAGGNSWVAGDLSDHHLSVALLLPDGANTGRAYYFLSKEYSDPNLRPSLEIQYTPPAAVPEPATMLLLGSGLIGLAGYGRKKFFKK